MTYENRVNTQNADLMIDRDMVAVNRDDLIELLAATHAFLAQHSRLVDPRSRELVARVREAIQRAEQAAQKSQ